MIGKNLLLQSLLREIEIVRHLHGKIAPGNENFKPTEGQRTTLELLRYLSYCGLGGAIYATTGDAERVKPMREASLKLGLTDIPAALDRQAAALKDLFASLDERELMTREVTVPWGARDTAARWLLDLPLKWLTGYRMQLFLYLKQSGRPELATSNCWRGEDPKPR